MKKRVLALGLILIMVLAIGLSGCGGDGDDAAGDSSDVQTLRVSYVVAESHASHIAFEEIFKKKLEETGKFKVELYPNGQLGGDADQVQAVSLGQMEMTVPGEAAMSGIVPEMELVGVPYLFDSIETARNALDGDFGAYLEEKMAEQNLVCLGWGEVGFREISNTKREITEPSDLKGIKIRTQEVTCHLNYFKALGANPTPMSFNEVFTGLQQGTIDAQENPVALTYNSKFHEVTKYMSLTDHVYSAAPVLINKGIYDGLSDELKETLNDVAAETVAYQRELIAQQNDEDLALIEDAGVKVTKLTDDQKEVFRKAAEDSIWDSIIDTYGQDAWDLAVKYNK
ncbi:TRAP transporter substrate-binding protein [bacterium 210820-DFI.6.37]|nr:TRAP transporter substrate-binding protein [bacterium 210820-DFI.6.37]